MHSKILKTSQNEILENVHLTTGRREKENRNEKQRKQNKKENSSLKP